MGCAAQMGGPIWNAPIHDPEFVQEMVAEAGAGMASHPTALPKCDAGSNDQATVERSRQRMVGILKSIAAEVRSGSTQRGRPTTRLPLGW